MKAKLSSSLSFTGGKFSLTKILSSNYFTNFNSGKVINFIEKMSLASLSTNCMYFSVLEIPIFCTDFKSFNFPKILLFYKSTETTKLVPAKSPIYPFLDKHI